ncbi:hypothetical protein J1N35_003719 [Gossypium stocksii]|uniref:Uncharacterized protein n=1 Tax=Gossypium stocksii TaxID=47602 RepID=A0A9D4AH07_9ROSI|nr:hypothetical protein J1N35_003719 [Gossypium stocksii]
MFINGTVLHVIDQMLVYCCSCKRPGRLSICIGGKIVIRTHTFHLRCREVVRMLEDVVLQLGLPVDGVAQTGSSAINMSDLCQELLGRVPG